MTLDSIRNSCDVLLSYLSYSFFLDNKEDIYQLGYLYLYLTSHGKLLKNYPNSGGGGEMMEPKSLDIKG